MLGGEAVRNRDRGVGSIHLDQPAVVGQRLLDERPARKLGKLFLNLALDGFHHPGRSADQPHAFVTRAMFGLGQQIRSSKRGVRRVIRHDQQLAWSGQQVNGDPSEKQPFRCDDVGVAGTKNLLYRANRGRAKGHRGDGLSAA